MRVAKGLMAIVDIQNMWPFNRFNAHQTPTLFVHDLIARSVRHNGRTIVFKFGPSAITAWLENWPNVTIERDNNGTTYSGTIDGRRWCIRRLAAF